MRKALHVFENMVMVLMPEQSRRQTRSSFKKRLLGLKAIYKVGGDFFLSNYLSFSILHLQVMVGHGFLWALGPLLLKAQQAVDPANPWLDPADRWLEPANPRPDEFSSDEETGPFRSM